MDEVLVGFVDAGFLRAEGGKALNIGASPRLVAAGWVGWFRKTRTLEALRVGAGSPPAIPLRTYWYDGALEPTHADYTKQRRFLDAIAHTSGVQLRTGRLQPRPAAHETRIKQAIRDTAANLSIDPDAFLAEFDRHWQFRPQQVQKGVDTLLALDLIRLAQQSVYTTAVLCTGDADVAEAVGAVQDLGRRVVLAVPQRSTRPNIAPDLLKRVDEVIDIEPEHLQEMVQQRQPTTP